MQKPKRKTVKRFDYSECSEFIEKKLGYSLRDTLGMFANGQYNSSVEYRDFWHFLCDECDINNGGEFYMPATGREPWQQEIIDVFMKEFGEGPYYTSW